MTLNDLREIQIEYLRDEWLDGVGFDAQSLGFVAPALAADLRIEPSSIGPLASSGLLGMMFGAVGLG